MKTIIQANGLTHEALYQLFPMVYAINGDFDTVEVQHDDPLVFPDDAQVDAAKTRMRWDEVRRERAPLLQEADWRIQRAEDDGLDLASLRAYRQALRDVTRQSDPAAVVWPPKPWDDSAQPGR